MFLYRCASCGSDRVQLREANEGFSYGKAALGTVAFGTVGAVAGLAGKKTTKYYCPNCGQTLDYPLNALQAVHIDEELMQRTNPSHIGVLRALKKTYPGIDWEDPTSNSEVGGSQIVKGRPEINPNATTEALLERIAGFIEDREWDNAAYYCEYLLDKEPSNPELYKYKLLIEHQSSDIYELGMDLEMNHSSLEGSSYNKFLKYGGQDAEKWIQEVESVEKEFLLRRIEARKNAKYDELVSKVNAQQSIYELEETLTELQKLDSYKDSVHYIQECQSLITDKKEREEATAKEREEAQRNGEYNRALSIIESKYSKIDELKNARETLVKLKTWRNVENEIEKCDVCIHEKKKGIERTRKRNIIFALVGLILLSMYFVWLYTTKDARHQAHYEKGIELMANGEYEDAAQEFRVADQDTYADYCQALNALPSIAFGDEIGTIYYTIVRYNYLDNIEQLRESYIIFKKLDDMHGTWSGWGYNINVCDSSEFFESSTGNVTRKYKVYVYKIPYDEFSLREVMEGSNSTTKSGTISINKNGDLYWSESNSAYSRDNIAE